MLKMKESESAAKSFNRLHLHHYPITEIRPQQQFSIPGLLLHMWSVDFIKWSKLQFCNLAFCKEPDSRVQDRTEKSRAAASKCCSLAVGVY